MAAFSTMALVGAGLLAGATASKLIGKKKNAQQEQTLAPGQTNAESSTPEPVTGPTPPVVDPGAVAAAGVAAGQKQRKKSAAGSILTTALPKAGTPTIGAKTTPRSLLGA